MFKSLEHWHGTACGLPDAYRTLTGRSPSDVPAAYRTTTRRRTRLKARGATETVDLFLELINDDRRDKAVELFSENAIMGISVPGSDERTNLRGRDKVGGWFIRAGDGFRMFTNDSRNMGASYIADVTVMRPGVAPMNVEANFRVENGEIVALFLQPN